MAPWLWLEVARSIVTMVRLTTFQHKFCVILRKITESYLFIHSFIQEEFISIYRLENLLFWKNYVSGNLSTLIFFKKIYFKIKRGLNTLTPAFKSPIICLVHMDIYGGIYRETWHLCLTCYRIMLDIKQSQDNVTNERLYQRVNQVPIREMIRVRQLKFTDHCIRLPTD